MTETSDKAVIELSADEKQKVSELHRDVVNAKLTIADADARIVAAEAARTEARAKASKATQDYFTSLRDFAKAHNVDLLDNSKRWVFDLSKMTFIEQ